MGHVFKLKKNYINMKRILFLFFFISQFSLYSQISKTSGILYTNGNPKTNSIDSQIRQNLNKN